MPALLKALGSVSVESAIPLILPTDLDGAIFSEGLLKVGALLLTHCGLPPPVAENNPPPHFRHTLLLPRRSTSTCTWATGMMWWRPTSWT